jgi:Plasmid rolling circle replication initiator protein and truncated derivatives
LSATKKGAQHCNAEAPAIEHELTTQYGDFIISGLGAQGEVNNKLTPKKIQAMQLASVYQGLGLDGRSVRMGECGNFIEYTLTAEKAKLTRANFCKDRLCPMCNWRRSLKIFGQVSQVMDHLQGQYRYLFLTLTVRNCDGAQLPGVMDGMQAGWKNILKQKRFRAAVAGSFRAIEITRNWNTGEYHPHYHVVLAVHPSYFHKGYISQAEWSEMWRQACGLEYTPICDIRKVTGNEKAVAEVSKYAVKGSDILRGGYREVSDTVCVYLRALTSRRLCSFTGVLREARKVLQLDDIEHGDLVHVEADQLREDVASVIIRYKWACGAYVLQ